MVIKGPGLVGWWIVSLLSVASFAATSSNPRLVESAREGDKETVRSLLKGDVDVNARQADGATALAWAAYRDDLEIAELLIDAGANVNVPNDYGATPLLLACANGSAAMVDRLLQAGADANAAAWAGETVLMSCARTGDVEAVKSLLTHGAEVNAKETRQGQTALMWAAAGKHPEVARALIEGGADVNAHTKSGFTPLMFAAQQGDLESARILLAAGANVNEATLDGDTALLIASVSGHEALSIFLLDNGADANAAERNGITALHYAVLNGLAQVTSGKVMARPFAPFLFRPNMVGLVKALLAHGANPNARLVSPVLFDDSGPGYGKVLRINFPDAGNVSPVGATAFLMAAISHDASLMRILAANGADPFLTTEENVTPLMGAAGITRLRNRPPMTEEDETKALDAVKLAVELGANVNAVDSSTGLTALHAAAFSGLNRIIQFLAENGADLDAKDKVGQTPLHKALNIKPTGAVAPNLIPAVYRESTAELLLGLGATPVDTSVAQASDVEPVDATK